MRIETPLNLLERSKLRGFSCRSKLRCAAKRNANHKDTKDIFIENMMVYTFVNTFATLQFSKVYHVF